MVLDSQVLGVQLLTRVRGEFKTYLSVTRGFMG